MLCFSFLYTLIKISLKHIDPKHPKPTTIYSEPTILYPEEKYKKPIKKYIPSISQYDHGFEFVDSFNHITCTVYSNV